MLIVRLGMTRRMDPRENRTLEFFVSDERDALIYSCDPARGYIEDEVVLIIPGHSPLLLDLRRLEETKQESSSDIRDFYRCCRNVEAVIDKEEDVSKVDDRYEIIHFNRQKEFFVLVRKVGPDEI